jgi:plasmid stabilization system protein ParE
MRARYSKFALFELDEIFNYIAKNSPAGAEQVERRVRSVVDRIARHPKAAQQVQDRPSVLRVPLVRYPYVIYYTVQANEVVILRIIHGARRSPWEIER